MSTIFISGGTGCIGSVTIRQLLRSSEVEQIVVASRSNNLDTLQLWIDHPADDPRLEFIRLDIADYEGVEGMLTKVNPTHILHLGAYQSPDCANFHVRGMEINTGGTMVLFDAAEQLPRLKKFVFASSAAVYGMRSMYPQTTVPEDVPLAPPNHYGIWKLAGEHLARMFYDNTGVPTVCLRLNTTYGKGRDQGKTSAPTNALKAVAAGAVRSKTIPFAMPYQGRENYHFVEDVGAHFAACTLQPFTGYGAFNIKGETIEVKQFLSIVKEQATLLGMGDFVQLSIAADADPNLFISDLNHEKVNATFANLPLTSIKEGVRHSLLAFRDMAEQGVLDNF